MPDHNQPVSTTSRLIPELQHLLSKINDRIGEALSEVERLHAVRSTLGPDALIPYGDFLKANHISYDLGSRLRDEGRLKVLRVGGKLMVRKGHASEFVRNLPLD